MNTTNNTSKGNSFFYFESRNACTKEEWLWCETCSATCTCAHHLSDHTRNDDPQQGHCSIRGCRCCYFKPYKVRKPRPKEEWEGSW